MRIKAISANALLSSTIAVAAPVIIASDSSPQLEEISVQSNKPEAVVANLEAVSADSCLKAPAIDVDHWSAEKNARFKELARNEALGSISIEELAELESLTAQRRFVKYPRSADEILWQRRQQKVTHGLVQALHDYIEFHETPRNT